jgi:NitT/TauT family transport system substrate-binding protein
VSSSPRLSTRIAAAAATGLLLLAGAACASPPDDEAEAKPTTAAKSTLQFGLTSPSMNFLPLYVAQEKGFFSSKGLAVEETQIEGSAVAIRAAVSGDVDVMGLLPEGALTGIAQGAKMKIIGATNNKIAYQIFVRPGIESLDQLAGKKVAILTQGNGTDILMRWLLDEKGSGAAKSQFISAGGMRERLAALSNGQADATLLAPPFTTSAVTAGMKQLGDLRELIPNYNGPNVVVAADRVITAQPQDLKNFMAGLAEAGAWIQKNPEEATAIGQKRLKVEAVVAKASFDFLKPTFPSDGAADKAGIQFSIDLLKRYGVLKNPVTLEQAYIDTMLPGQP